VVVVGFNLNINVEWPKKNNMLDVG